MVAGLSGQPRYEFHNGLGPGLITIEGAVDKLDFQGFKGIHML